MNLASLLQRSARLHPDRTAVFSGMEPVQTYRLLAERSARLASAMRELWRLSPNERVAIVSSNKPAFVEVLFAVWGAGLVVVPVNPRLHPSEMRYILEHSSARACFVSQDLLDTAGGAAAEAGVRRLMVMRGREYEALFTGEALAMTEREATDPAWLFYTSGTTGRPKGAVLSNRNLLAMTTGYFTDFERLQPGDGILHIAPVCHGSGLYILPHVLAAAAQIMPEEASFSPAEAKDLIERHGRVGFFAAPTIVRRLAEHCERTGFDAARLRLIVYGGAPMYREDLDRALGVFGPRMAQVYGQGETPMAISVLPAWCHDAASPDFNPERLGTVGYAQSVVQVRIACDEDRSLPPGELGEVLVRGDTVMNGYLDNPQASAEALRGGWLHTGDVGVMDADGFITLKDRSKDVIISGGSNIYPREVEEVLLTHPGVAEVSVIGVPDREWGEAVAAFVVRTPGSQASEAELDRHCLAAIARYKRPKRYHFIDDLPKSHIGKVLKTKLREMAASEWPKR